MTASRKTFLSILALTVFVWSGFGAAGENEDYKVVRQIEEGEVVVFFRPPQNTETWGYSELFPDLVTPDNWTGPGVFWHEPSRTLSWLEFTAPGTAAEGGYNFDGQAEILAVLPTFNYDGPDGNFYADIAVILKGADALRDSTLRVTTPDNDPALYQVVFYFDGTQFTLGGLALEEDEVLALNNIDGDPVLIIVGSNNEDTVSLGLLSGDGGIAKIGTGTLTLADANTYEGGTTLEEGTLMLGHYQSLGSGALTVTGNATMGLTQELAQPVANDINLENQSILTLLGEYDLTLSGTVSGEKGIISYEGQDDRTLRLTGSSGDFLGAIWMRDGKLHLAAGAELGALVSLNNSSLINEGVLRGFEDYDTIAAVNTDAAINNQADAVIAGRVGVYSGDSNMELENRGLIEADFDAVFINGGSAEIINHPEGVITAWFGIVTEDADTIITNLGTIEAGVMGIEMGHYETADPASPMKLHNYGEITGGGFAVTVFEGTAEINHYGKMTVDGNIPQDFLDFIDAIGMDPDDFPEGLGTTAINFEPEDDDGGGAVGGILNLFSSVAGEIAHRGDSSDAVLTFNQPDPDNPDLNWSLIDDLKTTGNIDWGDGTIRQHGGDWLMPAVTTAGTLSLQGGATSLEADHSMTIGQGGTAIGGGGRLQLEGTLDSRSGITVTDGGTLAGSGTLFGNLDIGGGGTVAPGSSIGTLTIREGDFTLAADALLNVELQLEPEINNDLLLIENGSATLQENSRILVDQFGAGLFADGDAFTIITAAAGVSDHGAIIDSAIPSIRFEGMVTDNNHYRLIAALMNRIIWPGADGVWSNAENWDPETEFADGDVDERVLEFTGPGGTSTADFTPGYSNITGLEFASDAGLYTITGSQLSFLDGSSIANLSDSPQTLRNQLIASSGGLILNAGSAPLFTTGEIDLSSGGNLTVTGAANTFAEGAVSGSGGIRKHGDGALVLTADNTYTGETVINRGVIQVGDEGNSGSLVSNVKIGENGIFAFNRADDTGYDGEISGHGLFVQSGDGTLSLTGDSSAFAGTTVVDNGTLLLLSRLGGPLNMINENGILRLGIDNPLANDTTVAIADGGIFDLVNFEQTVSTLTGDGQVLLGWPAPVPTGNEPVPLVVPEDAARLTVDSDRDSHFAGTIDGPGTFRQTGGGHLNLTGNLDISRLELANEDSWNFQDWTLTLAGDDNRVEKLDIRAGYLNLTGRLLAGRIADLGRYQPNPTNYAYIDIAGGGVLHSDSDLYIGSNGRVAVFADGTLGFTQPNGSLSLSQGGELILFGGAGLEGDNLTITAETGDDYGDLGGRLILLGDQDDVFTTGFDPTGGGLYELNKYGDNTWNFATDHEIYRVLARGGILNIDAHLRGTAGLLKGEPGILETGEPSMVGVQEYGQDLDEDQAKYGVDSFGNARLNVLPGAHLINYDMIMVAGEGNYEVQLELDAAGRILSGTIPGVIEDNEFVGSESDPGMYVIGAAIEAGEIVADGGLLHLFGPVTAIGNLTVANRGLAMLQPQTAYLPADLMPMTEPQVVSGIHLDEVTVTHEGTLVVNPNDTDLNMTSLTVDQDGLVVMMRDGTSAVISVGDQVDVRSGRLFIETGDDVSPPYGEYITLGRAGTYFGQTSVGGGPDPGLMAVNSFLGTNSLDVRERGQVWVNDELAVWDKSGITIRNGGSAMINETGWVETPNLLVENGGHLGVDGELFSLNPLFFGDGSILTGSGKIYNDVNLGAGALHRPGRSIGTKTIAGDYNIGSGAILEIEFDQGEDNCDRVDAEGKIEIEDGSILALVDRSNGNVTSDTRYVYLTAEDGIFGEFSTYTGAPLTFYDFNFGYELNEAWFIVTRAPIIPLRPETRNQKAVAAALQDSWNEEELGDLWHRFRNLGTDAQNRILSDLSPEPYRANRIAVLNQARDISRQWAGYARHGSIAARQNNPTGFLARSARPQQTAANPPGNPSGLRENLELHSFVRSYGQYGKYDSGTDRTGFRHRAGGIVAGLGYAVDENLETGLGMGYTSTRINFYEDRGRSTIESFRIGPYFSYEQDDIIVDGSVNGAAHWFDAGRNIPHLGLRAESDHSGYDLSGRLGVSWNLETEGWALLPGASLQYTRLREKSFTETGAGEAGLRVASRNTDSLQSLLGMTLIGLEGWADGMINPMLFADWRIEMLDDDTDIEARFVHGSNRNFSIKTKGRGRHGAILGGALNFKLSETANGYLGYQGELGRDSEDHTVSAGLGVSF